MLTFDRQTCKRRISKSGVALILAVPAAILAACTTVESQSFTVSPNSNVESAYIANDADFSRYKRLVASEMGIFFPSDSYTPPEDLARIRQIFRDAFLGELQHYEIVDSSGPETMRVEASLIDLRNSSDSTLLSLRSEIRDIASHGELLFLMEMRDSLSDRVLARAADSARTPAFATADGESTDWTSVEDAAQHWAFLFRRFLDQNLGK